MLQRSILAAGIIEDGELVDFFIRPKVPVQSRDKMSEMTMQANILAVIGTSNEDFFGEFGYLMIHWKHADAFIFPIELQTPKILAIQVIRPYDHAQTVQMVMDFLRRNKADMGGEHIRQQQQQQQRKQQRTRQSSSSSSTSLTTRGGKGNDSRTSFDID
jgi:hypothetical protein